MGTIRARAGKNGITFQAIIRVKGIPCQTRTFRRKTDAREWLVKAEKEIREGRYAIPQHHLVAEAIDRYARDVLPRKRQRTAYSQRYQLDWWNEHYGQYELHRITPSVLIEARDRLRSEVGKHGAKRSESTVNRYLAIFSHLINIAINEWEWLHHSPIRKNLKGKENPGRVRFLSEKERKRLLAACADSRHPDLLDIVKVAIGTGMRRGEIVGLCWENVDFNNCFVYLSGEQTKNASPRAIPLRGEVLDIMRRRSKFRRLDSNLVFPNLGTWGFDLRWAWEQAVKAAAIENFRFHDLRHTYASYLAMSGASLLEIATLMGHKTLAMVQRYAHLSNEHATSVVDRMHQKFLTHEDEAS